MVKERKTRREGAEFRGSDESEFLRTDRAEERERLAHRRNIGEPSGHRHAEAHSLANDTALSANERDAKPPTPSSKVTRPVRHRTRLGVFWQMTVRRLEILPRR